MSTVPRAAARAFRLRLRSLACVAVLAAAVVAPSAADAAIPQVFTTTPTPVTCAVQGAGASLGQRFCGTGTARVSSFDAVPIDVSVTFPPVPASGPDGNFPVVGIFHGWGGTKITPSSAATQRWVNQGYAVFSITDRGWGQSCGVLSGIPNPPGKPAGCASGYIRLMHNAYEVRDVQYLLGKLVDQGVIDRQRIGATGGSYGGGMALQLGALKDRVQMADGSFMQWQSAAGDPIRIAATAPEFPWSDLQQALMPNGSSLDYVADSPYKGVNGDHRFGIQKQNWNTSLFSAGSALGFYAPAALNEPTANLINWNTFNSTGGPYDGGALAIQQMNELPSHSGYYTDLSVPPAPALLSSGWNDDLFPVDETVRYYNKVRSAFPNQPIKMFHLDFGHNPRAGGVAADTAKLATAENAWFAKYVRGDGPTPADAQGGVDILTSKCSGATQVAGDQFTANDWASISPGEIRLNDNATKSILAPGIAPSNAFTSGNVCTTTSGADNASAATYKLDPAPASGFTIAGSPTIVAEFDTIGANDMVAGRLYDVAPGGATQQLIARGLYRPLAVGNGYTQQVWQLHPQAFKVAAGHVVKLELLTQDSIYARLTPSRRTAPNASLFRSRFTRQDRRGRAGKACRPTCGREADTPWMQSFLVYSILPRLIDRRAPADLSSSTARSIIRCRLSQTPSWPGRYWLRTDVQEQSPWKWWWCGASTTCSRPAVTGHEVSEYRALGRTGPHQQGRDGRRQLTWAGKDPSRPSADGRRIPKTNERRPGTSVTRPVVSGSAAARQFVGAHRLRRDDGADPRAGRVSTRCSSATRSGMVVLGNDTTLPVTLDE